MTSDRLRWGALVWLLTLQFFVVETVVQLRGEGHSRIDDVISDLGATTWPGHQAMNASFIVQAALIVGGALLLRPLLRSAAGQVAQWLFGAAAVGLLLVAVFPSDKSETAHAVGAALYLVGGALGLVALAYAMRPRSELLGTTLVVLGLVGAAATTFFLTGVEVLEDGATERAAAYVLPIGLAVTGLSSLRLGRDEPATGEGRVSRREERAQQRAIAAERARERDEALEAAARRPEGGTSASDGAAHHDDDDGDGFDVEDPWATDRRTE